MRANPSANLFAIASLALIHDANPFTSSPADRQDIRNVPTRLDLLAIYRVARLKGLGCDSLLFFFFFSKNAH